MALIVQEKEAGRVDWNNWQPKEKGTLCFVVTQGRILLIEKKGGWDKEK